MGAYADQMKAMFGEGEDKSTPTVNPTIQASTTTKSKKTVGDILSTPIAQKKKDPEEAAISYFIDDPAKEETIKIKALKKIGDIVDFLDNFNRVGYAVAGGLKETVKSVKGNEPLSKDIQDVGGAMWKGLTREERHDARDILREISPEWVDKIEKETSFNLAQKLHFPGQEENPNPVFNMDALSVPNIVASIALDPVTYIPFGAPVKAGGRALGMVGEGVEKGAKAILGEAKVNSIIDKADKMLVEKIYPLINITKASKRVATASGGTGDVSDIIENLIRSRDVASGTAMNTYKKVFNMADKNETLKGIQRMAQESDAVAMNTFFEQMSDKVQNALIDFKAKDLGVKVDDIVKFDKINGILRELGTVADKTKEAELLKDLNGYLNASGYSTAKYVKSRLMQEKGLKLQANKLAGASRDATIELHTSRFRVARDMRNEIKKQITSERNEILDSLKSGITTTHKMMASDVDASIRSLNILGDNFAKSIKTDLPETAAGLKTSLDLIKSKISGLTKYQADLTQGIQGFRQSDVSLKKINSLIRNLEMDVGRQQVGVVSEVGGKVLKNFKETVSTINAELGKFKNASRLEMGSIKGDVKASAQLQKEIVESTQKRLIELGTLEKSFDRDFAKEVLLKETAVRKARKKAVVDGQKWYRALTSLNSEKYNQEVIQKFAFERDKIVNDFIAKEVPEELRGPVTRLKDVYQEYGKRLTEGDNPLLKGLNPFYSPRQIQREFLNKVFGERTQFAKMGETGAGKYLKKRKLPYTADYYQWVTQNGGKVEQDAGILAMDYMRKMELKLARHNAEQAMVARLGYKEKGELPQNIQKFIQYIYADGMKKIDSPAAELGSGLYGTVLNKMKMGLTSINPAFQGRNFLSMPFLGMTNGMKNMNPRNWADAIAIKLGREGSVVLGDGSKISYEAIRDFGEKGGYLMSSRIRGDIYQNTKAMLNRYNWKSDPAKKFIAESLALSGHVDDLGRYVGAIAEIRTGKPMDEAFKLANKAQIDYNLLNSPADKVLQGYLGFYAFTRRNIERQVLAMANDPKQYAMLARVMDKVSNRDKLSNDELEAMNNYDRSTFKLFGNVVDNVREFTTLGFFPVEDAYQTISTASSSDMRQILGSRINPLLGAILDHYYGKEARTGQDFGNKLPAKYTKLIPGPLQNALGLTKKETPKYSAGEIVGTEEVLYGDPDTIAWLKSVPIAGRFINSIATLAENIQKGKGGKGTVKFMTGVDPTKELDVQQSQFFDDMRVKDALRKAAKAKGAKELRPRIYLPKTEKDKMKARQTLGIQ